MHGLKSICIGIAGFGLATAAQAEVEKDAELVPVVVIAAPLELAEPGALPATIDRILLDARPDTLQVGVAEALSAVPGVLVRERQNFAQDTQLSIRGVGARATFGIRGIRLTLDGIPASLPDGQGQLSHFMLAAAERIDVLRGPFSALYGNASGGVIQVYSATLDEGMALRARGALGSFGASSGSARLLAGNDGRSAALTASRFRTDGFREHSRAERTGLNAVFKIDDPAWGRLQLSLNHFDSPDTLDPLGLDRQQWREDPSQATSVALLYNTRKSVRQNQLGVAWEIDQGDSALWRVSAYTGWRDISQFLSVPVGAQGNPLSSGGLIDLDNRYYGADLRRTHYFVSDVGEFSLTLGLSGERLVQQRLGFENFVGDLLGVRGALRRDERNTVDSEDAYAQLQWALDARRSLLLGLRHSRVGFASDDRFISARNPDDSGSQRFAETAPVLGYLHRWSPSLRAWASLGRGFETPTFTEIVYRADGGAGLAFDLQPAISRAAELGLAGRTGLAQWRLVAYRTDTRNELAVARNVGGRSSFLNAGRSRRQGLEAEVSMQWNDEWRLQASASWLDARFRDGFLRCAGPGCSEAMTPVAAGSRLPGIATRQAHLRLGWTPRTDWELAIEAQALSSVAVADGTSERAPGYALVNAVLERSWQVRHGRLGTFVRLDNLFDRDHIGSVIVNEGNGRYYEPGAGRSVLLGLQWDFQAAEL